MASVTIGVVRGFRAGVPSRLAPRIPDILVASMRTKQKTLICTIGVAAILCLGLVALKGKAIYCRLLPERCVCGSWELVDQSGDPGLSTGLFHLWSFTQAGEIIASDGFCAGSLCDYAFENGLLVIREEAPRPEGTDPVVSFQAAEDEGDGSESADEPEARGNPTIVAAFKEPPPRDFVVGRYHCSFEGDLLSMTSTDGSCRLLWRRRDPIRPATFYSR